MDNATRSERSRNVALDAALVIIARDGPGRLTLDAIARESGLSKGGVMHHSAPRKGCSRRCWSGRWRTLRNSRLPTGRKQA
jgi:Bacterial regulatory proteins, tetR family